MQRVTRASSGRSPSSAALDTRSAISATATSRLAGADNLSAIFNQLFVPLVEIDLQGRVIAANERFCQLIERAPEAVLLEGVHLRELVHAADGLVYEQALAQLAAGFGPVVQELRLTLPDRRCVWVEIAATPLPLGDDHPSTAAVVVSDIGRRKDAESRAIETQQRFREVADAAPVFIWTSGTDRQRRHTWVNARWTEYRGRPMEAELGSGWTLGVHPDDRAACLAAYSAAFDQRNAFTAEYRLRRHDGEYSWVLDTGTPMRDEHGRFVGYIGSSVDISGRKVAEREREALLTAEREARSDAERANRLKDEFLSILSHELRTPLNAMLGWVHLLQSSTQGNEQLSRGLGVIERNARLQSRMVEDLLDMGGVMAGKMRLERRRVPLAAIVDGAVESLQPAFAAKGVTLRRLGLREDSDVDGDPSRLHQIVWNLLSNALKFTPADGEVAIELRRDGARMQILVRDNGLGIDAEFLPFVFERFRQGDPSTRRTQGGLGIGLALVRSLAELHGGEAGADSDGAGRGAVFTVTLPRAGEAGPRESPPQTPGSVRAASTPGETAAAAGTPLEGAYGSSSGGRVL
jgi:PAS domain S-box-containing protein